MSLLKWINSTIIAIIYLTFIAQLSKKPKYRPYDEYIIFFILYE